MPDDLMQGFIAACRSWAANPCRANVVANRCARITRHANPRRAARIRAVLRRGGTLPQRAINILRHALRPRGRTFFRECGHAPAR